MITVGFIGELCGQREKKLKGTYGIEIETEVTQYQDYPSDFLVATENVDNDGHGVYKVGLKHWTAKTDGSLRNFGIEYVLKEPLSFTDAVKALEEFGSKTENVPFLQNQPSTSVHVHVNMAYETPLTLANFGATWFLFENILLDYCGDLRRSNLFATGIRHSESQIENWVKMLEGLEGGHAQSIVFSQSNVKYSSLNLGCLLKLGSVEIRCFKGTTDTDEIITWLSIIDRILEFSKTPGLTPKRLLLSYKDKDVELLSDVFGDYSNLLKPVGFIDMMDRNLKYVMDIATCVKSWETFGMEFEKYKSSSVKRQKKSTPINDYMSLFGGGSPTLNDLGIHVVPTPEATSVFIDDLDLEDTDF